MISQTNAEQFPQHLEPEDDTMTRKRVGGLMRQAARNANREAVAEITRMRADGLTWEAVAAAMRDHEREHLRRTRFGAVWNVKNCFAAWRRSLEESPGCRKRDAS